MSERNSTKKALLLAAASGVLAVLAFALWLTGGVRQLSMRIPGTDHGPGSSGAATANPVLAGKVTPGPGSPGRTNGSWPQFRGLERHGISQDQTPLARTWKDGRPKELWSVEVGEGYAGPAVHSGRVYLMDYDRQKKEDALRCLSFDDGREIWRFSYPIPVKRNHGMSRTVPAVWGDIVAVIGPKCHVAVVNADTGILLWGLDLVREYGTTIPPWYAGQCPLIEDGRLILAPAGGDVMLAALSVTNGEPVWKSPNPRGWKMTHSSIMPMTVDATKMYVYCGDKGVAGVAAEDGRILWDTTEWKISIATVPSPVILSGGRIFLSGGYNAGSVMLRVKKNGDSFQAETLFRLGHETFGATQQTPILFQDHIYGARPDGKFACLTPQGKVLWTSEGKPYGLGPFVIADGLIFAVNDNGLLRILEAAPDKHSMLAQAPILDGRESWGPLALASGRLLARDLTRMVCLDLR